MEHEPLEDRKNKLIKVWGIVTPKHTVKPMRRVTQYFCANLLFVARLRVPTLALPSKK